MKNILKDNAKKLRLEMTKEEKHLWYDFLKNIDITVKRQKVIDNYIVDFYIASEKIIIEVDGFQHYEGITKEKDLIRDEHLKKKGYKILRYTNRDINTNFSGV